MCIRIQNKTVIVSFVLCISVANTLHHAHSICPRSTAKRKNALTLSITHQTNMCMCVCDRYPKRNSYQPMN